MHARIRHAAPHPFDPPPPPTSPQPVNMHKLSAPPAWQRPLKRTAKSAQGIFQRQVLTVLTMCFS